MLKVRIIPTLLWKGVGLVKGVGFDSWRRVGPVVPAIKVYNRREVDELFLVDISATDRSEAPDIDSVSDFSDECFVPLTVGGGISEIQHVQHLLRSGADKVSINSAAYANPGLIDQCARRFGSQCVVASIDARRLDGGGYRCASHAGTIATDRSPRLWARELVDRGAGEILITSVELDGTMDGYDLRLIETISSAVNVPVIASGGAGTYEDFRVAIQEAGASAVAAASMFHFTQQTPAEAKDYLAAAGVAVRRPYSTPSVGAPDDQA